MDPTAQTVPLRDLFRDFPLTIYHPIPEVMITGIAIDSRQVKPGNLFVAIRGGTTDGHDYIDQARGRGAAAVVGDKPFVELGIPYVQVADSRQALTYLAAGYYQFPARNMVVIGVTGTDGKTTTVNLIYQILKAANLRAGMISTINAVIGGDVLDTGFHVTTPDAHDVQRYLARMAQARLTHVVIETTSHGLAQYRVDACEFDLGVVTNITHEHLDEHGTFEAYQAAKARLFSMLGRSSSKEVNTPRAGVLNLDDSSFGYLAEVTRVPVLSYGLTEQADVRALDVIHSQSGLAFKVSGKQFLAPIRSDLVGKYNVYNILAAIATTVGALGIDPGAAQAGIAALKSVPGRMERIDMGQDFLAIVDFAHTPNALRCALETARQIAGEKSRVIVVFGSAGLRDREKRRMMPRVAAQMADFTILTAEDPRTESLSAILGEMSASQQAAGGEEGRSFWRIPDRGEAIRFAVELAKAGDVILVCGKGHEQSMCFGTTEYAWDDRLAMHSALAEHLGLPGPKIPYLPTQDRTVD